MLIRIAVALLLATAARAEDAKLVVVLPLDVTNAKGLDDAARMTLEEGIRTIAGDALEPLGFTVLTGETTLKVLKDNGVDAAKACESSCAMEAAQELKASLFISGSVATTEGEHVAYVRIFESAGGKQLGSVQLEGVTVKELRKAFEARSSKLFAKVSGKAAPAEPAVAPPEIQMPSTDSQSLSLDDYRRGIDAMNHSDFTTAVAALTSSIQRNPKFVNAYVARGGAYIGLRKYNDAAADYLEALQRDSTLATPVYGLARIYERLNESVKACESYRKYASSSARDVVPQLKSTAQKYLDTYCVEPPASPAAEPAVVKRKGSSATW